MNIQTLYESGRFPHAVLLVGDDGNRPAEQAIKLYNCDKADTVFVKELMPFNDKKTAQPYAIKPLREVIASGNLRPQFGDIRLFVFNEFDSMSEICQNALLKFIEEPHEFNKFVLTAQSKSKILPTILSRVVTVGTPYTASADTSVLSNNESAEIAKAIVSALIAKDEYKAAAQFSKVKDRQALGEVLQALLQELLNAGLVNKTDVIYKYIKRMETNPNIPMTTSACIAELCRNM